MATDLSPAVGDAFAKTACRLLSEYGKQIELLRANLQWTIDDFHRGRKRELEPDGLRRRWDLFCRDFQNRSTAYEALIRKCSQWLQNGPEMSPARHLELQTRLASFEGDYRSMLALTTHKEF